MTKALTKCLRSGVLALLAAVVCRTGSAQAVLNGGFEDNGGASTPFLTNWTLADQFGSSGSFYAQTGTGSPLFGQIVPAPPEGSYAAMTDSGGAGSHVLYQDFVVPGVVTGPVNLSFQVFVNNQASDFVTPDSLDYSIGDNQQARVDLLLGGSDPFSLASGDVLLNLYRTNAGDPLTSGYSLVSTDVASLLQAHLGETLRLRFAEVDTLNVLNFGVDDVVLGVRPAAVPEPSASALLAGLMVPVVGLLIRRRKLDLY